MRRKRYGYNSIFEGVASDITGRRIDGTRYRNAKLNGDAYLYHFRVEDGDGQQNKNGRIGTKNQAIQNRLSHICTPMAQDILFLYHSVGWSDAQIANDREFQEKHGCWSRHTIWRHRKAAEKKTQTDFVFRSL